jgi:PAS domain S-box-containing protein
MYASTVVADEILQTALDVVGMGDDALHAALDELPAAIYVTDTEGVVTYFNPACIDFAGRTPVLGQDRWCVTWKLFTDEGEFLPHDECPMAVAIKTKFPVRGVTAVAERPDGTRVNFRPYPTPVIGEDGELRGAVNMLIDVTDSRQAEFLRSQARKCRRLAASVSDNQTADTLSLMASEYDEKARSLG